jgi:hypothetical protein
MSSYLESLTTHMTEEEKAEFLAACKAEDTRLAEIHKRQEMSSEEITAHRRMKAKLRRAVRYSSTPRSL